MPVDTKLYDILQVSPNASVHEIKKVSQTGWMLLIFVVSIHNICCATSLLDRRGKYLSLLAIFGKYSL